MIQSKALPARFRRSRIALVGYGDVAARLVKQRKDLWGDAPQAPRLIPIGRSTGWNLDLRSICSRVAGCATRWIILVPPAESPAHITADLRSSRLANALRWPRRGHRMAAKSLVYISTTGVYGDHAGAQVTEVSPLKTTQPRSLRRIDAERTWRSLGGHILRVPGITAEDRLPIERIRRSSPALRAEEDVYTNHIHANDLARLAWAAVWRGRHARVTNTVMPVHLKMGDYFDQIADAFGVARCPRVSRVELEEAVRKGTVSPMMLSFMQDSRQVLGERIPELRIKLHYRSVEDLIRRVAGSEPQ